MMKSLYRLALNIVESFDALLLRYLWMDIRKPSGVDLMNFLDNI